MDSKLVGQFTPIEKFAQVLKDLLAISEQIYKSPLPNTIAKFTVNLSTARSSKYLSSWGNGEGLFNYDSNSPSWYYCKLLVVGTGTFTMEFVFPDKTSVSLANTEVNQGDEFMLQFTDIKFTNTAQPGVTNPVLWLEKRYF